MKDVKRQGLEELTPNCTAHLFETEKQGNNSSKIIAVNFEISEVLHVKDEPTEQKRRLNSEFNFGTYNAEECIKNILTGTSDFEIIDFEGTPILGKTKSVRRRKKYSEDKGEVCIDAYINGSLKNHVTKVKRNAKQTAPVDIYINAGAAHTVSTKRLENYYNSIINQAYQIVLTGRMVNIYSFIHAYKAYNFGADLVARTPLKLAGQSTDFKRLSTAIYPAFLRYFFWKAFNVPMYVSCKRKGYPTHHRDDNLKALNLCFEDSRGKEILVFDLKSWEMEQRNK